MQQSIPREAHFYTLVKQGQIFVTYTMPNLLNFYVNLQDTPFGIPYNNYDTCTMCPVHSVEYHFYTVKATDTYYN